MAKESSSGLSANPTPRALLLADAVLSTPPGGTCLLCSDPGYGRRALLQSAIGEHAVTVALPPRPLDRAAMRDLLSHALGDDSQRTVPEALLRRGALWLVILDVDPVLHADAVPELLNVAAGLGPTMRLAVTGSPALQPAFARLRAAGSLVELDGNDLALDAVESKALLHDLDPEVPPAVADEVIALCDGWPAALASAARHRLAHPGLDLLTWMRTHGAEKLFGSWLDDLPNHARDMLLDTAIVEQLHPGLVATVYGPGTPVLADLASPHGAVRLASRPWDDDGPWFERHPLLTSLLRYLAVGRSGEVERHRRAASWFADRGLVHQELRHRLLAGEATTALDRLHRHEHELLSSGQAHMALRWYHALPGNGLTPEDLLRETWAHALSHRLPEAHQTLDLLRLSLRTGALPTTSLHPRLENLAAEADVVEAWICEQEGNVHQMLVGSARARAGFGEAWSTNSHQLAPLLQARAALILGDLLAAGRLLAAVRDEPFASSVLGEGRRTATEAELAWARGEVVRARSWAARHHRWLRAQDRSRAPRTSDGGLLVEQLACAEDGDVEAAIEGLRSLIDRSAATGSVTEEVLGRLAVATVQGMQVSVGGGLRELATARDIVLSRAPDGGLLGVVAMLEARLRLAGRDTHRAERLLRGLPPGTPRQLLLARIALHRGQPTAASVVRAIEPGSPREEAEHALLLAWASMGTSRQRAEHHLLHCADLCAENGMSTLLTDVPDKLLELARRTASYHVHDQLQLLVRRADAVQARGPAQRSGDSTSAGSEALTRGELQLLALLPSRDSNTRIAEQLGVSVNTVKTRLRRLYTKLGVHDRDEAVERASAAGLLSARASDGR